MIASHIGVKEGFTVRLKEGFHCLARKVGAQSKEGAGKDEKEAGMRH
jgi:hypothetical protein